MTSFKRICSTKELRIGDLSARVGAMVWKHVRSAHESMWDRHNIGPRPPCDLWWFSTATSVCVVESRCQMTYERFRRGFQAFFSRKRPLWKEFPFPHVQTQTHEWWLIYSPFQHIRHTETETKNFLHTVCSYICTYIHSYMCIYTTHTHTHTHIYIERDRDREA